MFQHEEKQESWMWIYEYICGKVIQHSYWFSVFMNSVYVWQYKILSKVPENDFVWKNLKFKMRIEEISKF